MEVSCFRCKPSCESNQSLAKTADESRSKVISTMEADLLKGSLSLRRKLFWFQRNHDIMLWKWGGNHSLCPIGYFIEGFPFFNLDTEITN